MKTTWKLVLAAFVGIALGAGAFKAVLAQATGKPPAFYIAEFVLTDPEGIKPYSSRVASTFEPFGGRFVARGGRIAPLEGEAPKGGIVVIAFDSMEKAQAWYDSPAYRELMPIRHRTAKSRVFFVEGTAN